MVPPVCTSVVVAQLAERLLPITAVHNSNLVIVKISLFTIEKTKTEKEAANGL